MVENICGKLAFITVLIFMFRIEIFPNFTPTFFDVKVSSLSESKIMFYFFFFACLFLWCEAM